MKLNRNKFHLIFKQQTSLRVEERAGQHHNPLAVAFTLRHKLARPLELREDPIKWGNNICREFTTLKAEQPSILQIGMA